MNPTVFVDIAVENAKREKATGFFGQGEDTVYLINGMVVSKENFLAESGLAPLASIEHQPTTGKMWLDDRRVLPMLKLNTEYWQI